MARHISRREALKRSLIAAPSMILAGQLGFTQAIAHSPIPSVGVESSEVRMLRGAPTLFINGQPDTGFTFFHCNMEDCGEAIQDFAGAGIDLFSGCGLYSFLPDGSLDYDGLGRMLEAVIAQNPEALILPRTGVHYLGTRHPWYERYQDELQVSLNPENGKMTTEGAFSMSSTFWREQIIPLLGDIVRFTEKHFGKYILGYHIHGGLGTGEWAYLWSRNSLSDYSQPQQKAFRGWLRERYQDDPAMLQRAWQQETVTFETVEIPRDRVRAHWQSVLFQPEKEQASIDYMQFHSETMAEALLHCARTIKGALADLGKQKVCGAYYGYHFKRFNNPANLFNQGHYAGDKVFHSPDIDFVCAPYSYTGRESGHMYHAQSATGSHRVHGKLYWCEEDTATHLVPEGKPHFHRNPDAFTSVETLKRNTMGILRDGGSLWYMDLYQTQAFDDPQIMQTIGQLQALARQRLQHAELGTTAQVAIFVSDASKSYLRQDSSLVDALISQQVFELGAMGCSFDAYRIEDLPELVRQPWLKQYRLIIFLDTVFMDQATRQLVDQYLKKDARVLLWLYGSGLIDENGAKPENMQALTGFRLALENKSRGLWANSIRTGGKRWYGTSQPIKPVVYGADPEAAVHGWFLDTAQPALLERDWGDWRSIWSGAPALPAAELRLLARQAGVHLYVENGDQVIAEANYLTVHAGFDGGREIMLPQAQKVVDALTGEVVAAHTDRIKTVMKKGQTGVWQLVKVD